jgi:hypothetical protein
MALTSHHQSSDERVFEQFRLVLNFAVSVFRKIKISQMLKIAKFVKLSTNFRDSSNGEAFYVVVEMSTAAHLLLLWQLDGEVLEEGVLQQLLTRPPLARVLHHKGTIQQM